MSAQTDEGPLVAKLNRRSRDILRQIVDAFLATGQPIGSRTLSRRMGMALSAATIRNVMADLEELGLLFAPHVSAGRLPTEAGLRLFVHGLLEIGDLSKDERSSIEGQCAALGRSLPQVLEQASILLSGLSQCAGLVMAPKQDRALKHIEFVSLAPGRALVVMVHDDGLVENRIIDIPLGMPAASLIEASNYLADRLIGRTLAQASRQIERELKADRAQLDALTRRVVEAGLASWSEDDGSGYLIVRGQAKLLEEVTALADLERIRALFEALETKEALIRLIDATRGAEGVQIFIGAENELFSLAGCSLIIAPYANSRNQIVGALGVIGPTRINYARIIPMVDYTAKLLGRLVS